ncbi:acetolactate synthase 2 catalytic subunit [Pseudomarimonas salicorniae]|uniref:Acetolactate synthase n=1 Tax=Pseudomarimonas salicorniae TaxID=2933270 RepID=A0ABT0GDY0_9GAMM|nr:acetolactate synthase 2 catalytic subunit [Lysobacter sp. CAU 1642]MCK7592766.1 acetolactate synthase 2 catalytic subunit [Lysobacter sp. CAU 1642]
MSTHAQPTPATTPRIRGADALLRALEAEGVRTVFGYPGGAIMPVYDALVDSPIRHILVRHEQGAALAANGYARASGEVGVCMATSGPGATNLVTGIADAYLDSVPMVAITGQVPSHLMGTDAFQEVDIFGITLPIVKHSWVIRDARDIAATVREAFRIAREGRPGPVLIDLPKDVAVAEVDWTGAATSPSEPATPIDRAAVQRARTLIQQSQRPLLYTGYGVGVAGAEPALRRLAEDTGIPVVSTLKGLGGVPTDHPQFLGMLGMHGSRAANLGVQECDLLICVGARFDDRATGKLAEFAPHAKVIHLDTDAAEISKLRYAHVHLLGTLTELLPQLDCRPQIADWQALCAERRAESQPRYDAPGEDIYAPALLRRMSEIAPANTVVACDVGQHQMWVAQHCIHRSIHQHLTSGGLGTMGFGVPAAMGVAIGMPERPVVCVSGDGSIMMNIQELATLRRYQVPVKIILLDNSALGMVRQWQELFFAERYSEIDLSDNPDFAVLARAFGIEAASIERRDQVEDALKHLFATDGPFLLHVRIDPKANVWPLVPPNTPNHKMMDAAPPASTPAA